MKKLMLFGVSLIMLFLTLISCAPSTTVTKLYLQEIEVAGPINNSPVHITDSSESAIIISSKFIYNSKKTLTGKVDEHTLVNQEGIFQVDTIQNGDGTFSFRETPGANKYQYEGNNLTWNLAELSLSLDVDFKLSRKFALFFGGNYSSTKDKSMWGGLVGIGLMSSSKNSSIRFDIGLNIQEVPYDAFTIASVTRTDYSSSISYVTGYYDVSKKTQYNPFAAITVNSSNPDWPANIFLFVKYGTQSIVNFTPEDEAVHNPLYYGDVYVTEDNRGEATAGIFDLTPGLYFNFGEFGRIILGAKFNWIVQIENIDNSFFILPMLQLDFRL